MVTLITHDGFTKTVNQDFPGRTVVIPEVDYRGWPPPDLDAEKATNTFRTRRFHQLGHTDFFFED